VTFECQVSLKNAPVTWTVNGVDVVPGLKYQVLVEDFTHRLDILSAKLEDAGEVKATFRDVFTSCQLTVQRTFMSEYPIEYFLHTNHTSGAESQQLIAVLTGALQLFTSI
jgi:hypothetical protein